MKLLYQYWVSYANKEVEFDKLEKRESMYMSYKEEMNHLSKVSTTWHLIIGGDQLVKSVLLIDFHWTK